MRSINNFLHRSNFICMRDTVLRKGRALQFIYKRPLLLLLNCSRVFIICKSSSSASRMFSREKTSTGFLKSLSSQKGVRWWFCYCAVIHDDKGWCVWIMKEGGEDKDKDIFTWKILWLNVVEELGDVGDVEDVEVEQVIVDKLAKYRFSCRYRLISLLSTNKEDFHRGSSTNWPSTDFP